MGDTSSSLQVAAWQPLQKVQQSPTHNGPPTKPWPLTPSHQHSPETADGAENMESGTASGAIAAWSAVYIDLNPGTPEEGRPAGSGCPGQLILSPQGITLLKMDLTKAE